MFLLAFEMRNIMKIAPAAASVCLLILSACAGREPSLPTIALASDQSQECTALEAEVIANANTARSKIASNNSRDGGDVAMASLVASSSGPPCSRSTLILLWHQPDRINAIELGSRERVTAGTAWQTASEGDDHSASLCGDRRGDVAFRT
jgi:hypothetical protein